MQTYTDLSIDVIVMAIPMLNAALACFQRIESFLESDIRRDHRLPLIETVDQTDDRRTVSLSNEIAMQLLSPRMQHEALPPTLITVQDASFAWNLTAQPVVRDLNFTLQRQQFCFIIGPVGSGKSTLLKGLLGETPSSQGFVYSTFPTTSFVDQTSWIQNGTGALRSAFVSPSL